MRTVLFMLAAVSTVIFLGAQSVFSAQSTADVPATAEMKQSLRTQILGDQTGQNQSQDEYVIGHGDIISVSVYGEGDMAPSTAVGAARPAEAGDAPRVSGAGVMVMMDGRVSLLHIGDVEVVGLTLTQLADYLKQLYATVYEDPIVTTTLVQSNSLRYTVMGNVTGPGVFFLDYPLTIVQAVARSGGFTEWANRDVTIVRETIKEAEQDLFKGNTLSFDYDDFVSGKNLQKNITIRSGDIVIVH
ncbi:polysaccharide biosynthesis/export family protein [Desulfofustis glycolicus]|uniref:Polysaccharide export outer membrane protein n=1 Tax=Desulfofustis glycolicus DSM 9705 TaxID=1121409 RepID=A0A1M5YL78_9BACT|nr:polysaccharide biosynthesis/export family protein [Desulfofustis glycolicus]SHI12815.1 polysaccharide export outer membrane protein [Desulfofustis glycolicus DSM 9705]